MKYRVGDIVRFQSAAGPLTSLGKVLEVYKEYYIVKFDCDGGRTKQSYNRPEITLYKRRRNKLILKLP